MDVQYWEYKTLLVPSLFSGFSTSVDDYRKQVIEPVAAATTGTDYQHLHEDTAYTNVEFYDTADGDFNANHFLVRWRYTPGKPEPSDLTLKYRQSQEEPVANANVQSSLPGNEIKLKDEVLLPNSLSEFPGMRSDYSKDNELSSPSCVNLTGDVDDWVQLFPGLGDLNLPGATAVNIVNGIVIQQAQVEICELKFHGANGGEIKAKGDIALWVNTNQQQYYSEYLAAEFSYSFKSLTGPPPADALAVCNSFYEGLQAKPYQSWIQDEGTKTSAVYDPTLASGC